MNFIPNKGDMYYFASHRRVHILWWGEDASDIGIARDMGIFPHTHRGKELVNWQHALLRQTSKFWEWVDDYEIHT